MNEEEEEHKKEFVETKFKLKREIQKLSIQLSRLKDQAKRGNLSHNLYSITQHYVQGIWELLSKLDELAQEEE